jgi:hypothetical protein
MTQFLACTILGAERYLFTAHSIFGPPREVEEEATDARVLAYSNAEPLEYSLSFSISPLRRSSNEQGGLYWILISLMLVLVLVGAEN